MLLSIPETMNIQHLYEIPDEDEAIEDSPDYVFRGMICFTEGHYFSFFRKVPSKYIVPQELIAQEDFDLDACN